MVPALSPAALQELIVSGASLANVYNTNGLNLNRNADNRKRTISSSGSFSPGNPGVTGTAAGGTGVTGGQPVASNADYTIGD
jgi:hypothetical protein